MPERLLLVEDREQLRDVFARGLASDFTVDVASDGVQAIRLLAETSYAVVVSDVRLPGAEGPAVLAAARALDVPPEVILMTAYADVAAAVAALKAGAYDYLAKPVDPEELRRVARRAADKFGLVQRTRRLEGALAAGESALVGISPGMVEVRRMVERLGPLPVPVLILGESGTGKEVVARELHRVRARGPFVAVNCGAIPENLLEAELFGVARGAYTGAHTDRMGLLESAGDGTVLLDEIGELPASLQVKLNRVIEEGEVRRIGETRARPLRARIVAATHVDLDKAVAEGRFRPDLYFRLKVVVLRVPPLRARIDDLPLLVARFLHLAHARYGTPARHLAPDALATLEAWSWPGNVRELRHAVEHAAVLGEGERVDVAHLPDEIRRGAPVASGGTWRAVVEHAAEEAGRAYLEALLVRQNGNVSRAAAEAGVERESLHRLLRRHGVDPARFRGPG